MHPSVRRALTAIDAAVFSGDTFLDPTARSTLKTHVTRWALWIEREEEEPCSDE